MIIVFGALPLEPLCQFIFFLSFFFFFCSTGVWSQSLQLEPFQQPIFSEGFFQDRVLLAICPGWLRTMILLISASWEARITSMNPWHPASVFFNNNNKKSDFYSHQHFEQSQFIRDLHLNSILSRCNYYKCTNLNKMLVFT
jgi:hypothetical protein